MECTFAAVPVPLSLEYSQSLVGVSLLVCKLLHKILYIACD